MTALAIANYDDGNRDLNQMSDADLVARLKDNIRVDSEVVMDSVKIVYVLDHRNFNYAAADIDESIIRRLRQIGSGKLLPEVYSALADRPSLLSIAVKLPPEDQKTLARDEGIEVARLGQVGTVTIKPGDMTPEQRKQVFGFDRIRTPEEQIAYLRDKEQQSSVLQDVSVPFKVDCRRKLLIVSACKGGVLTAEQLRTALKQMGE